jgi:hypothetical protein
MLTPCNRTPHRSPFNPDDFMPTAEYLARREPEYTLADMKQNLDHRFPGTRPWTPDARWLCQWSFVKRDDLVGRR